MPQSTCVAWNSGSHVTISTDQPAGWHQRVATQSWSPASARHCWRAQSSVAPSEFPWHHQVPSSACAKPTPGGPSAAVA
jgi:hypothetical protein